VAALCNSLWATNVEVDSVARVFNKLTSFQQRVRIASTKLHKHQINTLLTQPFRLAVLKYTTFKILVHVFTKDTDRQKRQVKQQ